MDPRLRRRYLQAMGIQVWSLRGQGPAEALGGTAEECAPEVPDAQTGSGAEDRAMSEAEVSATPGSIPPATAEVPVADMDWDPLRQAVATCRACGLCETRTQTVFGVGDRQADLMIVGEAPGADEDRQGEPFVGRAGQLLNLMLGAIGLRREQVYIGNVLKCRPPGNRDPRSEEVQHCWPFLMRQVTLIRPRVLLSVGRISAQSLLQTSTPIGRLRGQWFDFGPERVPLTVTYHPAYLLRSPEQKAKAWQDLLQVARRLREPDGSVGKADGS